MSTVPLVHAHGWLKHPKSWMDVPGPDANMYSGNERAIRRGFPVPPYKGIR